MTSNSLPLITDCRDCGACCLHMGYPAFFQGSDRQPAEQPWIDLPADLKVELEAFVANYDQPADGELDGVCVWFDQEAKACRHHEHRPNVCRDFQVGGSGCLAWREAKGIH